MKDSKLKGTKSMNTKKLLWFIPAAAAVAVVLMMSDFRNSGSDDSDRSGDQAAETGRSAAEVSDAVEDESKGLSEDQTDDGEIADEASSDQDESAMTEEEKREAEEEKLVDEFDAETDRWMDAGKTKPPTMAEVGAFRDKFRKLPKDRKEECLHRALNLIPDDNVMLLAGILLDKSEDKELVELVFNDILNRDEDVKKPILDTIFKDKTHPCWADTAWILDVTSP